MTDVTNDPETGLLTNSIAFPLAICPDWQVAFDRLQWVLQYWRAPRWRDRAFCRTRGGLELRIRELIGREHQAAVAHLPDWHPDVAGAPTPIKVVSSPEPVSSYIGPHAVETAPLTTLQGDDYQLDYYEDGYPKLPACLDRRKPLKLVVNNPPRGTIKEEAA